MISSFDPDGKLYSFTDSAKYLGIRRKDFDGLVEKRIIPVVCFGTWKKVQKKDLDRFIELHKGTGKPSKNYYEIKAITK